MKRWIGLALVVALVVWVLFAAYALGLWPRGYLPPPLAALKRPTTVEGFGSSFAALGSLLSLVPMTLGLWAVLLQGRELRETIRANERSQTINALTYLAAAMDKHIDEYETVIGDLKEKEKEWKSLADKVNRGLKPARNSLHAEAIRLFRVWNPAVELPPNLEALLTADRSKLRSISAHE